MKKVYVLFNDTKFVCVYSKEVYAIRSCNKGNRKRSDKGEPHSYTFEEVFVYKYI